VYLEGFLSERMLGNSFATSNQAPNFFLRLGIEALLGMALVSALSRSRTRKLPPGSIFFLAYGAWAIISSIENGQSPFLGFLYARYTLYTLVVYFIAWNCTLRQSEVIAITRLIVKLFILQIVSSVIMLLILGEQVEWRVGTLSISGGELATVFPLVALGFAMGWYFFVRPRWWVLVLGIGFGVVGYASNKRAIYFLVPVFFVVNVALYLLIHRRMAVKPLRTSIVLHGLLTGMVGIVALVFGMMNTGGFADIFSQTGVSRESASGVLNFAEDYNSNVRADSSAWGRNAASAVILVGVVTEGPGRLLFGWGPDALPSDNELNPVVTKAGFSPLNVFYGIVGWSRDAISIGLVGSLFYLLAYASVFRTVFIAMKRPALNRYARMLGFGACSGVLAVLVCYFIYASNFMVCGSMTFILTFSAGLVSSPAQKCLSQPTTI